jgi:predicted membrane protein (TIGR00267 family)
MGIKKFSKLLKDYNRIAKISEMARRYFVMNSFDGILTIIGILLGSFIAHINDARIIIVTGISASLAMAVSGIWGSYLTETAERQKKLKDLSKHLMSNIENTLVGKAQKAASIIVAAVDGLAPLVSSIIVISPFFFSGLIGINAAYLLSIIIALSSLVVLGAFLGHISQESKWMYGVKMFIAGIVSIVLIFLFEKIA